MDAQVAVPRRLGPPWVGPQVLVSPRETPLVDGPLPLPLRVVYARHVLPRRLPPHAARHAQTHLGDPQRPLERLRQLQNDRLRVGPPKWVPKRLRARVQPPRKAPVLRGGRRTSRRQTCRSPHYRGGRGQGHCQKSSWGSLARSDACRPLWNRGLARNGGTQNRLKPPSRHGHGGPNYP